MSIKTATLTVADENIKRALSQRSSADTGPPANRAEPHLISRSALFIHGMFIHQPFPRSLPPFPPLSHSPWQALTFSSKAQVQDTVS